MNISVAKNSKKKSEINQTEMQVDARLATFVDSESDIITEKRTSGLVSGVLRLPFLPPAAALARGAVTISTSTCAAAFPSAPSTCLQPKSETVVGRTVKKNELSLRLGCPASDSSSTIRSHEGTCDRHSPSPPSVYRPIVAIRFGCRLTMHHILID